jgi:hydrogenase/urease accessory protein HupE
LFAISLASTATAHPLSQGALEIVIHPDKISVTAHVTSEEVSVTNSATGDHPLPGPWAATGESAFEQHASYLAAHLHFTADETALANPAIRVMQTPDSSNQFAVYDLEYSLPKPSPRVIELSEDVLKDGHFAAGVSWDATYVVKIAQEGRRASEGLLLTQSRPINFICDWTAGAASFDTPAPANKSQIFRDYFGHGVSHILTGYDHLLFISALVLAATSLWDLVKVVTAFTLAHSITLTLAALDMVRISPRISEPLISLSIVVIALQNVFQPDNSKGWIRLGAAFFFGLFHGLGFAGGLLDAMHEMHSTTVFLAILGFSVGVEVGHQMVVIPLFAALNIARATRADESARNRLSMIVQRFGSAAISLGGLWFLVAAMKLCITGQAE